ncbi:TonB-dependent receptor [Desulfobacula toluolica]|uniref:TonB-dependent receptor n=1 Tax=Desulfobacula toluolica (strain DSM 7467 / Tol2) TaxID=651182 RepID=K0NL08_DESTT|nr:TonB-dependent receptor [Desulfobacula toluolica]CCK81460.1 TonB-dependent receptor [Desulfobacula toluolica Tol2]
MTKKYLNFFFFLTFFLALWVDQPLFADETDSYTNKISQSIVVTAQKRTQDLQDVPDSITVLNDTLIEDAQIDDMESLSAHVPGLEFHNFGSRRHSLTFMRGIKSIHSGEPAIGYYVDGVNYSKSYMFDFPLFDVERIEILKGPQGTLYGRNAMAGVINVHTRKPDNEAQSEMGVTVGSDDLTQFKGFLRVPILKDKLFFGLSGLVEKRDGYMENDTDADGEEGRHTEGGAGRLKLRFLPSDVLDILLSLDGQTYDEGVFPFRRTSRNLFVKNGIFPADNNYHYSHDFEGTAETDFWGLSLNVDYTLTLGTLTSSTGYRDFTVDEFIDADFSPLDMTRMNYIQDEKNFSQEFRLASPESESVFNWLAGLYFFKNESKNHSTTYYRSAMAGNPNNPFGAGTGNRLIVSDGTNEGAALFGQGTYTFFKKFDATLGVRYEYEDAEILKCQKDSPDDGSSVSIRAYPSASNNFDALLPKISLGWHVTGNHMVYTTFSGGHRSGGFNTLAPSGSTAYEEETSRLYEVGTKLSFLDKKLIMNLSGFYIDIEDEQIAMFDTSLNTSYIVNAGESHRLGIEAEISYTPFPGLDFNAGLTVLEAEYDNYEDTSLGTNYAGNKVFGVPEYSVNMGIQYRCPLRGQWDFLGRMDFAGYGKRYFDDANTVEEKPYCLVNAKIGIEGRHMDIYLWSKNLLDRHHVLFENAGKGFAEDGEPMTIGLTLAYRF